MKLDIRHDQIGRHRVGGCRVRDALEGGDEIVGDLLRTGPRNAIDSDRCPPTALVVEDLSDKIVEHIGLGRSSLGHASSLNRPRRLGW